MKKYFLPVLCILICVIANAQSKPCSGEPYRQFDFWIGEWEVFNNLSSKKAGDSKISLMLDSCVILEEWTSASVQNGLRFAGKSYNSYNAAKKRWQQYWVDNTGSITEYFIGHYENNKMIVQTENEKQPNDTFKIQKMTFYNLAPDKIRQHGESSTDNGKTWATDFDLEYRRRK